MDITHKQKISEAMRKRYQAMTEEEKKAWSDKRQEGRRKTFELLKALKELNKTK